MQIVAPDILEDVRQISVAICGTAFTVGFLLWVLGWRGHRFWIVLAITITAGILGMNSAHANKGQPLFSAVLFAVAAGALALALVRVVAFTAGGLAALAACHQFLPAWNDPVVSFLIGGLLGLLLFHIWTMILTSAAGTLLMAYAGLGLAHKLGQVDIVGLADRQPMLLNGLCGAVALVGVLLQFLIGRGRSSREPPPEQSRWRGRSREEYEGGAWFGRGESSYRRAS